MRIYIRVICFLMMCFTIRIVSGDDAGEIILDNKDTGVCTLELKKGQWQRCTAYQCRAATS